MDITREEFFRSKEKALKFIKANCIGLDEVHVTLIEGVANINFVLNICNEEGHLRGAGFFASNTAKLMGDIDVSWRLTDKFWQAIYPEQYKFIKAIEGNGGDKYKLIYANIFNKEQYITTIDQQITTDNKGLQYIHILPDGNLDNWLKRSISIQFYLSYFGFNMIDYSGNLNITTIKVKELLNLK